MGNTLSIKKINYEQLQASINDRDIIISTLSDKHQECLIKHTISIQNESNKIKHSTIGNGHGLIDSPKS